MPQLVKPRFAPALSNLPLSHQGKTRDTFEVPQHHKILAVVATPRLSTHNVIHESVVPFKEEVLTALVVFWLTEVLQAAGIRHHLFAFGAKIFDHLPGRKADYPEGSHYRTLLVKRLKMIPIEFIYRSYLMGTLYKLNQEGKDPYGLQLPDKLPLMTHFKSPLFTPTDKSETDDPLDYRRVMNAEKKASEISRKAYTIVSKYLKPKGIVLVDSKFELGEDDGGGIVLADEIATPDSSRYCEASQIVEGQQPDWLDKQVARNEAERIWKGTSGPPITFSPKVIEKLSITYLEIFHRITGMELPQFQRTYLD